MKLMTFGLAMLAGSLYGCAQGPDSEIDRSEDGASATSVKLASFKLSNGNVLTMTELTSDGEIIVGETTPAGGGERFVVDDFPGASPLELFARLAPAGAAVPERIVASATAEDRAAWMGGRQISREAGVATFRLNIEKLGWQPVANAVPGQGSCDPSTGYQYFEDHHCYQMGPYGYGSTVEHCNNGKSFSYWQQSEDAMRHTYTRTAACDGTGRIRHSRIDGGDWLTVLDEPIEANTVATWVSYRKDGLKKDRRARSEPIDPLDTNAYVRQWSKFFDQVVDNAP